MKKLLWFLLLLSLGSPALAQTEDFGPLEQAAAQNKKVLAQYTWVEVLTLSIDGKKKLTKVSSVEIGPDGNPQKTLVSETKAPKKNVRGPLRKRVLRNKTDEFKNYTKAVVELARQYTHLDPQKLKQAIKEGDIKRDASPGPGLSQATITNYLKSGDSVTIVLDAKQKQMKSVEINSYLEKPEDKVSIDLSLSGFPEGGSHLQQGVIKGQSKKLQIQLKNSDYRKR